MRKYKELMHFLRATNSRIREKHQDEKAVRQTLDTLRELDSLLGFPSKSIPNIVHVTGTNGKGSVSWKTSEAMRATGLKTGLFYSPHIVSFRERFRVNGQIATEEQIEIMLNHLYSVTQKHGIEPTFFETVTALGFLYFAERGVEALALEAGLGGRKDATNIIPAPRVAVVTSIGIDHANVLGNDVNQIAREKLGVVKPGSEVVIGPTVPRLIAKEICDYYNCNLTIVEDEVNGQKKDFDSINSHVAIEVIAAMERSMSQSFEMGKVENAIYGSRPPFRFQRILLKNTVRVVLDVAHNHPALESLLHKLRVEQGFQANETIQGVTILMALSADKEAAKCAALLRDSLPAEKIHVTQATHGRAMTATDLAQHLGNPLIHTSVSEGIQKSIDSCKQSGDLLVVCGTMYMIPEVLCALETMALLPNGSECAQLAKLAMAENE